MFLQLRLCCRLSIPRNAILSSKLSSISLHRSHFSTTAINSMPRKVKLKPYENEEEAAVVTNWKDYAPVSRNTLDEVKSVTNFGSVRVDGDNMPQISGQLKKEPFEDNKSEFGGSYTDSFSRLNAHKSDYLSLLMEENENKYSSITPLIPENLSNNVSSQDESVAKQHFSFGKFRENKTIPVNFENTQRSEKSDLNYFDELMFQESYSKFSTEEANKIREVQVDTSVEVAREQSLDPELNLIDQEYFSSSLIKPMMDFDSKTEAESIAVTKDSYKLNENDDLNFIDEQFFNPQSNSKRPQKPLLDELSSQINVENNAIPDKNEKCLPSTSWFESDITAFEPVVDDQEEIKPETDIDLKTRMKSKRAEKLADKVLVHENAVSSDKVVSKDNVVAKPSKKSKAKTSSEGSALEYVRKLRKSQDSQTSPTHPHDLLGQHFQDRFLAATSNLQTSNADKKLTVDDEEVSQHVGAFVEIKKYKPPDLETYTKQEVRELLFSKIIYNNHDIVALWKPYGIPMFLTDKNNRKVDKENTNKAKNRLHRFSLECFLPDLANRLEVENLYEVHRLDSTTTGVVLYAKTKDMELKLRKQFFEKKVQKSYLCICNGVPHSDSGIIDIPVGEGSVGGRTRMTLRPDYNSSKIISNKKSSGANISKAVTKYRVVSSHNNASLLETKMMSGKKHQIRLHLGLGLGCPILGDHKFSYPDQLGKPQRVKGDIVHRLNIRKSKSRELPIFLHARRISIPDVIPDGNLVITANLPHFFTKTMRRLKLRGNRNENND